MNEKKMTQAQARKILNEYLALDSDVHNEFLDAIRTLIQPQTEIQCGHSTEEIEKSFMEDVEAVKEQLPNGDLISKQAVQNYIAHFLSLYLQDNVREAVEAIDEVIGDMPSVAIPHEIDDDTYQRIKNMPSVVIPTDRDLMLDITEAINDGNLKAYTEDGTIYLDDGNNRLAVPTEHWIYLDECANEGVYCSKCHKKIYTLDFAKKVKVKFCPNCGADMRQPQADGDLISRQAVLDLVADYDLSMGQVVRGIHALPSVKPQEPTGHWIAGDGCREVYAMEYECSECGCNIIGGGDFCKWCGAKMD